MKAKRIISLGAGVQSSALALMAARGDIPPVDAAIFADTQDEPVKVYEWLQWLISEIEKSPFPFPVHIVTEGKLSDKALIMRVTKDGRKFSSSDIPVFTKAADGTVGKIRSRACTRDFKLVPIFRKAKEIVGSEGMKAWRRQYRPQLREWAVYQKELVAYRKAEGASDDLRKTLEKDAANGCETSARALEELLKKEKRPSPKRPTEAWDLMQENALVEQLIGISTDEIQRMKPSRDAYFRSAWPLIDLGLNREACIKYVQKITGKTPPRSACHMCFSGDTRITTWEGDKPISSALGEQTLLVPNTNTSRMLGVWKTGTIRSFGFQETTAIKLRRGKTEKVVRATAEHRWQLKDGAQTTTSELQLGDKLMSCDRVQPDFGGVRPSGVGVAHGFTFGDGTTGMGDRSVSTNFFGRKVEMIPYFSNVHHKTNKLNGSDVPVACDLPRAWKRTPDLEESRSYLFGWLAGYFAADGTVSKNGKQATIDSSVEENVEFFRTVCYHLGIRTSPVHRKEHVLNEKPVTLYRSSIEISTLPESFFLRAHHLERVLGKETKFSRSRLDWVVVGIEQGVLEEVFCATVDGERFTLADNLLTFNCPYHNNQEWLRLKTEEPEAFQRAVEFERELQRVKSRTDNFGSTPFLHRTCLPIDQVPFEELIAAKEAKAAKKNAQMSFEFGSFTEECLGLCGL